MSKLFSLSNQQLIQSAVGAVLTAVVKALYTATSTGDFNVATFNWYSLLGVGFAAFIGFVAVHFSTDSQGNVLGIGSKPPVA